MKYNGCCLPFAHQGIHLISRIVNRGHPDSPVNCVFVGQTLALAVHSYTSKKLQITEFPL